MTQEIFMLKDAFGIEVLETRENPEKLNAFIERNIKFIKFCAYKSVHRFITESDDEYSIALSAFNEAIESFDESKGSFSSFAQMVIKRRLLDYLQAEYRHKQEISVEPYTMEGELDENEENPLAFELKKKTAELSEQNADIQSTATVKDEIDALSLVLSEYGFGFMELTKCSPTAQKTQAACAAAINTLISSPDLMRDFRRLHALPIKELSARSDISKKILDRHRKYIIAAVEIVCGDYPLLSEYMHFVKKEGF
jgi:RNA polymerase sigma factor